MMKRSFFLLALICLLSACDSKNDPPTAAEMIEKENSVGAPTATQHNQSTDPLSQTINAGEATKAKIILSSLVSVIEVFKVQENRAPASLDELVSMGYIKSLPPMPVGYTMTYDPKTGRVRVDQAGAPAPSESSPEAPSTIPADTAAPTAPVTTTPTALATPQ